MVRKEKGGEMTEQVRPKREPCPSCSRELEATPKYIACNYCNYVRWKTVGERAEIESQKAMAEIESQKAIEGEEEEEHPFFCSSCEEGKDESEPLYECPNCGTTFIRSNSADGMSHRCPDCGKFSVKTTDDACLDCEEEMEEWEIHPEERLARAEEKRDGRRHDKTRASTRIARGSEGGSRESVDGGTEDERV